MPVAVVGLRQYFRCSKNLIEFDLFAGDRLECCQRCANVNKTTSHCRICIRLCSMHGIRPFSSCPRSQRFICSAASCISSTTWKIRRSQSAVLIGSTMNSSAISRNSQRLQVGRFQWIGFCDARSHSSWICWDQLHSSSASISDCNWWSPIAYCAVWTIHNWTIFCTFSVVSFSTLICTSTN